jgi:hypothetical protein
VTGISVTDTLFPEVEAENLSQSSTAQVNRDYEVQELVTFFTALSLLA